MQAKKSQDQGLLLAPAHSAPNQPQDTSSACVLPAPPPSSLHAGLVKAHIPGSSRSSGFSYSALRKGLRLLVNEPDQMSDTPTDVSYLYKVCAALEPNQHQQQ